MAQQETEEFNEDDPRNTKLGAKIRHLIGVSGYRFGYRYCQDKKIAHYVGVAPATWTRMKSGVLKADVEKLGLLTEYFRLDSDYRLTFEVFLSPTLGDFKAILKEHGVGAYGAGGLDVIRAKLTAAFHVRTNGISMERTSVRAGGLAGAGPESEHLSFRVGETVTLRVTHPEGGHLLVLNDGPDKEIACLMPSRLAPHTEVHGRVTRLPTDESPVSVFAVSEPSGRYRLYTIWSRKPTGLDFIRDAMAEDERFLAVPATGLRQLAGLIERFDEPYKSDKADPAKPPPYEIRILDYVVMDRAAT